MKLKEDLVMVNRLEVGSGWPSVANNLCPEKMYEGKTARIFRSINLVRETIER